MDIRRHAISDKKGERVGKQNRKFGGVGGWRGSYLDRLISCLRGGLRLMVLHAMWWLGRDIERLSHCLLGTNVCCA